MQTEIDELNNDILKITTEIKEQYPELYRNLNEMPITVPNTTSPEVKIKHLRDYLESLKSILNRYNNQNNSNTINML